METTSAARSARESDVASLQKSISNEAATRKQRNFLKVFDQMCKALRFDYVDAPSFVYSGYGKYEGMLETLNPIMFESAFICDRMLTQILLEYLSWYNDPSIRLLVSGGAACAPFSLGYHVVRYDDELYVDYAEPGASVSKGDKIIGINGYSISGIFPEVERVLMSGGVPEREDWSIVLAYAKRIKVRHPDESIKELKDECPHVPTSKELGSSICSLDDAGECCLLTLCSCDMAGFSESHANLLNEAAQAKFLIIDVRGVHGGNQDDAEDILPLMIDRVLSCRQAFNDHGVLMNYTRKNVMDRIDMLQDVANSMEGDAANCEISGIIEYLNDKKTAGLTLEEGTAADESLVYPRDCNLKRIVILADRDTADAPEWLVRAAAACPKVMVVGRATRGSLDNTCLASRVLDEDFTLVYPTAAYRSAKEGYAVRGCGITPDIRVPWTPLFLEKDVDMKRALEFLGCSSLAFYSGSNTRSTL